MAETPRALAGLRVVELATGVGGPYCGKLFVGLGADVIKIEPPGGDPTRGEGPFPGDEPHPERSGLFLHLNTGKRSVVLDLQVGEDRRIFAGLLARADVLILSHRPSELRETGIDLDEVQRRFPRLIVTDVTSFGLTGPYAEYLGGELVAYALSGYMILTGAPDREPIKSYGSLVEYEAGAHAALGTLAALFARERDGRGQVVDVSAMEAGTFMLGGVEQSAYFYHRVVRRNGTRLLGFAAQHSYPSTIRPCKDGYVHAHSNNRHLDLLGALIPNPRLQEPDLLAAMMGHADEIDAIMDAWLADKDRVEVVRRAQELRLPFTEVMAPGEVMADPHHRERGSFVTVEHPAAGRILQPGAPFLMHGTPWRTEPAPLLGQHAEQVRVEALAEHASEPQPPAAEVDDRPLRGVRVIDFTNAVAGPIASFILGDLGAEVIKVEAPNGRPLHPAGTAPLIEGAKEGAEDRGYDRMLQFNELNHAKRSLVLDVAKPDGREAFLELVQIADVVVENFAPRVMPNLGLDYTHLRALRPDIISVSMPAFGLSGPYRDRISYGPGIDAMSGFSHLTGYEDGPPMKPGNFFCDQNAGVHSAFATLAALWHRRRSGEGQQVELAMIEGEFQILGDAYVDYAMNGRERFRSGNDHPWMAPHGVFRCAGPREPGSVADLAERGLGGSAPGGVADRGSGQRPERASQTSDDWIAIAVENDEQWRALCKLIRRPDLAEDPHFATTAARHENRRLLDAPITLWTEERTQHEAQRELQEAGVAAGAAMNAFELLYDSHVRSRHGFDYVTVPNVGPTPYPRIAFLLGRTPVPIAQPAPAFGEANDYALHDLLGMAPGTIAALEERDITTRVPVT